MCLQTPELVMETQMPSFSPPPSVSYARDHVSVTELIRADPHADFVTKHVDVCSMPLFSDTLLTESQYDPFSL